MEIRLAIRCDPRFAKKAAYVFDVLLGTLGLRYRPIQGHGAWRPGDLVICYGDAGEWQDVPNTVRIRSAESAAAYFGSRSTYDAQQATTVTWEGEALPLLFSCASGEPARVVQPQDNAVVIPHDIIASAFFFLSCWQEVTLTDRDQFQRFPYEASLQRRLDLAARPVVMEYANLLDSALRSICDLNGQALPREPLWKDGAEFAVCLTHDVHRITQWSRAGVAAEIRRCAGLLLKHRQYRRSVQRAVTSLASMLRQDNPVSPALLVAQEHRHGFRSSFYFMTGRTAPQDPPVYWKPTPALRALLRRIAEEGAEVGLHPSYRTSSDLEALRQEKIRFDELVGEDSAGSRQHFVRLDVPFTWRLHHAAGLRYDSTLYFAEQPGFRAGWCFPYRPYDPLQDEPLAIWELPITVMDGTMRDYQRLTAPEGLASLRRFIGIVKRHHGLFVLLWHSDFSAASLDWAPVYEQILQELSDQRAFVGTCREVLAWWQARAARLA